MLHSVPALVDEIERRLISGQDPTPLLAGVQWNQLVGWPTNRVQALDLKRRVGEVLSLLGGLQAPVRAALMALDDSGTYRPAPGGSWAQGVKARIQHHV
ncbi:MAG: hypothetical protein HY823_01590 [Acidobacteria bacterium]|nr:hypothetical protein [Acidobacteriota bacterium]